MASNKFLGKGLADIRNDMEQIPDISVLTGTERVVIKSIPLSQVSPNPDQPRKVFSETELQELADSIKEHGVLVPVILRSVKNKPYLYEIVAGERRYRAATIAGLAEIPAVVKSLSDSNAMEIALIENVQRENLNPIEEAEGYKNLMEKCGYGIVDITKLIGKSESYIRNLVRLTVLPETVKILVQDGTLSASHARTIAVSDNPEQLAYDIINGNMSVAETQSYVKKGKRSEKSRSFSQKSLDENYVNKIESNLTKKIGFSVSLKEKRGGAGDIVIHFSNRVQMEDLIKKLASL